MKPWNFLLGSLALALLGGCMTSSNTATQDGLSGTLINAQGSPVANALVKAYGVDSSSGTLAKAALGSDTSGSSLDTAALDSTWTDAKGRYTFSHLKNGNYNLEGTLFQNGDTLVVTHRDVHFQGAVDLGRDTLKAPGIIFIQALWNGTPVPGVHCSLVGGPQAAVSDDSGRCLIVHVPPGVFQVALSGGGFSPDTSGTIWVYSGRFSDAGSLALKTLPVYPEGCWSLHQSNGYYATLFIWGQGKNLTDSIAWVSVVTGKSTTPGTGTGSDSGSTLSFDQSFPTSSIIGYYTATIKGDSLINGTTRSNQGDAATWYASRIVCPD